VLTAISETEVEEGDLRNPPNGRHFVRLEVNPASGQSGPYPVELGVRVTGKVIGPAPTPDDGAAEPAAGSSGGDDGTSDVVLAAGGAGGILLGVFAGGAAAGLGRRRTA
jgi:hypothetical protein